MNGLIGSILVIFMENRLLLLHTSRAFWRNDLNERIAYQPVDTAVIKEFRGHGIFYEMTKQALGLVEDAIVYNYPNNNSLQGYLNLGWRIINVFNLKLFDSLSVDEFDDSIDSNYISWRFKNNPVKEYYYIKRYNKYFLLSKKKYNIYYVLAEIDRNEASHFKKAKIPILLYYSTKKNKIKMLNNKSRIVLYGENDIEIYNMFKGDAI
jgi:hypothetical protein